MAVKNDRITFSYLKRLNEEIKSNNPIRQNKAYQALSEINHNGLNPGLLMYIYYLQGKYHYLDFKRDDNLKSIAAAVECYRLVFQTARQHRVFAKNPKYYFKYAESLHKLSQYTFCLFEQNKLHNKAYLIAIHSSNKFPESTSLQWLKHHILAN
ncbi:hypothetical protein [uncultured Dokdonia sp.]|uniref:hypothetical protein n=1 Tax=uncultured Dokdonia sp. TaxID=575653 RepID=UPI0026340ECF|nr:hypothetical protein [uncultured Dokdonia sp.]